MVQKSFKLIKIWLSHQRDKRGQILNKKKSAGPGSELQYATMMHKVC